MTTRPTVTERPPLASVFAALGNVPFDAPLQAVADLLFSIATTTQLDTGRPEHGERGRSLQLVAAKLQTFKERPLARAGTKFGFVEFHVRVRTAPESAAAPAAAASSSSAAEAEEAPLVLCEASLAALHRQIDDVLATTSAAAVTAMPLVLRRVPDPVLEHLRSAPLVASARDPLKALCLIASRAAPIAESAAVATSVDAPASPASAGAWTLREVPMLEVAVLRDEHPNSFPAVATADSVKKFLRDGLPESRHFLLSL
jgi:hypothetical protein